MLAGRFGATVVTNVLTYPSTQHIWYAIKPIQPY